MHVLEAEVTQQRRRRPDERTESRKGQRNGYKPRKLKTRVGILDLPVSLQRFAVKLVRCPMSS
jgi:transposase-like protein